MRRFLCLIARWLLTAWRWEFVFGYFCGVVVLIDWPYGMAVAVVGAAVSVPLSGLLTRRCRALVDRIDPPVTIEVRGGLQTIRSSKPMTEAELAQLAELRRRFEERAE